MKINFFSPNFSFKSTNRSYQSQFGENIGCNSWMFRNDIDWRELAKYEAKHFHDKDKVNIVMFAASDGSEAYTKIISLYENFGERKEKEAEKFFPITAYDVDKEILKAANSGLIKTCLSDRLELQMKCDNYEKYFEYTGSKLEILNDAEMQSEKVLKAKDILTKNVKFSYGDMFYKIHELKDESNTILMCRNILGYFCNYTIQNFIESASNVLKTGSLFAVGEHDSILMNIKYFMGKNGFKNVLKNVYQKI